MIYLPWLFDGSFVVVTVAVDFVAWAFLVAEQLFIDFLALARRSVQYPIKTLGESTVSHKLPGEFPVSHKYKKGESYFSFLSIC